MNNNTIDALVYAQIKNNIPENNERYKQLLKNAQIADSGKYSQEKKLDEILNMTTIKRAYCMGQNSKTNVDEGTYDPDKDAYKIIVKIPFNNNYKPTSDEKKRGYRTKEVYVPKKIASKKLNGGAIENAFECQSFYGAYCENMKYLFELEYKETSISNPELFADYAECACYGDSPFKVKNMEANIGNVGGGFPPKCYIPNCGNNFLKTTYIDPVSKLNECQQTICQSVTQVGNITGSDAGVASFTNKIKQECGRNTQNNNQSETPNQQNNNQSKTQPNKSSEEETDKSKKVSKSSYTIAIVVVIVMFLLISSSIIAAILYSRKKD